MGVFRFLLTSKKCDTERFGLYGYKSRCMCVNGLPSPLVRQAFGVLFRYLQVWPVGLRVWLVSKFPSTSHANYLASFRS